MYRVPGLGMRCDEGVRGQAVGAEETEKRESEKRKGKAKEKSRNGETCGVREVVGGEWH